MIVIKRLLLKNNVDGYTLIESMAALTILGVTFAYIAPIFFYSRLKIDHAQKSIAARIITQRILTKYESQKVSLLPSGGTLIVINDPDMLTSMGKQYDATIEFCPVFPPPTDPNEVELICSGSRPDYRVVKISVGRHNQQILSITAAFADKIK